ncbi:MAG: SAM-dependent methyltransferase [Halobacteriovoraceae bacterium]|nr:SAM-dependent methyltransferase [Halobacteriovoraceae bacterium]|tara:strand:- start:8260 stop:8931 length:672 start_codon:yes stop_codon:yes gene_type:complete
MKAFSKPVTASSYISEEDLLKIAGKFSIDTYKRPSLEKEGLKDIFKEKLGGKSVIFDTGCGIGESSYKLAQLHPDKMVLGIDKSVSRIERNNAFKKGLPSNLVLMQADLQDAWPALYELQTQTELNVCKQYILYPNPWPKLKGVKRRWYANPMLSFILGLRCEIEIRSNWQKYLEDFSLVAKHIGTRECSLSEYVPEEYLTPFEKKYHLSSQTLHKLIIDGEK